MTTGPAAAEAVLAEACAALRAGCREDELGDGGRRLEFWVAAHRTGAADELRAALRAAGLAAEVAAEPETADWEGAIRAFHRGRDVAGRLFVRPPWQEARPDRLDVVIEPGMAFGTAQHATTLSCLELLVGLPPGPLLDAGCGSGVLALAALRLGFRPVIAVDDDPLAVSAAMGNARRNGLALQVRRARLGTDPLPVVATVVANIQLAVLAPLAAALAPAPPARAILSGLRDEDDGPVRAAWASLGLRETDRREREGWLTLLLERA